MLKNQVRERKEINGLRKELACYSWDVANPSITLSEAHLLAIIKRSISGQISLDTLSEWADAIECREDIEMSENLQEIIFEFANPVINGEITVERLLQIKMELESTRILKV